MKAKNYLLSIKQLDNKIQNKKLEIQTLYTLVESVTIKPKEVNVQTSAPEDKLADTLAKIVDMKDELQEEMNELLNIKFQTVKLIRELQDDVYVNILIRRYVKYDSWEDIALDLGFTERTVFRKHGFALIEFQKILDKNYSKI